MESEWNDGARIVACHEWMAKFEERFGREVYVPGLQFFPYDTMSPDEFVAALKRSVETGVAYEQEEYDAWLELVESGAEVD